MSVYLKYNGDLRHPGRPGFLVGVTTFDLRPGDSVEITPDLLASLNRPHSESDCEAFAYGQAEMLNANLPFSKWAAVINPSEPDAPEESVQSEEPPRFSFLGQPVVADAVDDVRPAEQPDEGE